MISKVEQQISENAASLEKKRKQAIEYLGNKWILKGGKYNKNFSILTKNASKNS